MRDPYPREFHTESPEALKKDLERLVDALRRRDAGAALRFQFLPTATTGPATLQIEQALPLDDAAGAIEVQLPPITPDMIGRQLVLQRLVAAFGTTVRAAGTQTIVGGSFLVLGAGLTGLTRILATPTGWSV